MIDIGEWDTSDLQPIAERTMADGFVVQEVFSVEYRWKQSRCWQSLISGVAIWSGTHLDGIEVWSERVMRSGEVEKLTLITGETGIYTTRDELNIILRPGLKAWEFPFCRDWGRSA